MSGLRVLVTGGTGVIGAWAVRELAAAGHEPVIATRGASTVGAPLLAGMEIAHVEVDLEDAAAVRDAVADVRPDMIAHLASAKPWQMDAGYVPDPDPGLGVRTIVNGTVHVLEAARREGVRRVVYASSKSAYAPFVGEHAEPSYQPVPESYPNRPTEVYGITKLAAEQLGDYYREHLGVDFISLRFGSTYGPFKRGAGTAPAGLIASAIEGDIVRATYGRHTFEVLRDEFVYNRDVGRGIVAACEVEQTSDHLFNIGTGIGSSIADVVAAINSVEGIGRVDATVTDDETAGQGGHLVKGVAGVLDCSRAAEQLGFVAAYDLAAGIRDAAAVIAASHPAPPVRTHP